MSTTTVIDYGVTIAQLAHYPTDDGNRYELIDGDLHVTTQPHFEHQSIVRELMVYLTLWSRQTRAGHVFPAPGVIVSERDAVAPDLVWVSTARAPQILHPDGKLHGAPDLVIEVLSPGTANAQRDRQTKRDLYDRAGVPEYWIVDRFAQQVEVYRRAADGTLALVAQVPAAATLTSPLLPGFACAVATLFVA